MSKSKAFADNKSQLWLSDEDCEKIESIVGRGENGYNHMLTIISTFKKKKIC